MLTDLSLDFLHQEQGLSISGTLIHILLQELQSVTGSVLLYDISFKKFTMLFIFFSSKLV